VVVLVVVVVVVARDCGGWIYLFNFRFFSV
jgi:hypothetical protein